MIAVCDGHFAIEFPIYQDAVLNPCGWDEHGTGRCTAGHLGRNHELPHPSTPPSQSRSEMERTLPMLSKNAVCSIVVYSTQLNMLSHDNLLLYTPPKYLVLSIAYHYIGERVGYLTWRWPEMGLR